MESAQATKKSLEEEGYQRDYHEYDMGHEIPPVVSRDLNPGWLRRSRRCARTDSIEAGFCLAVAV